jgi:hypothetical protein
VSRITKDCFGTVISTLTKMKECVRCELLAECRSINWQAQESATPPVVMRRGHPSSDTTESAATRDSQDTDAASRAH